MSAVFDKKVRGLVLTMLCTDIDMYLPDTNPAPNLDI